MPSFLSFFFSPFINVISLFIYHFEEGFKVDRNCCSLLHVKQLYFLEPFFLFLHSFPISHETCGDFVSEKCPRKSRLEIRGQNCESFLDWEKGKWIFKIVAFDSRSFVESSKSIVSSLLVRGPKQTKQKLRFLILPCLLGWFIRRNSKNRLEFRYENRRIWGLCIKWNVTRIFTTFYLRKEMERVTVSKKAENRSSYQLQGKRNVFWKLKVKCAKVVTVTTNNIIIRCTDSI